MIRSPICCVASVDHGRPWSGASTDGVRPHQGSSETAAGDAHSWTPLGPKKAGDRSTGPSNKKISSGTYSGTTGQKSRTLPTASPNSSVSMLTQLSDTPQPIPSFRTVSSGRSSFWPSFRRLNSRTSLSRRSARNSHGWIFVSTMSHAIASDHATTATRILRKPAVLDRVGLSDTTLWRLERAGRFPRSIRISQGTVGWRESDVEDWIRERAEASSR